MTSEGAVRAQLFQWFYISHGDPCKWNSSMGGRTCTTSTSVLCLHIRQK